MLSSLSKSFEVDGSGSLVESALQTASLPELGKSLLQVVIGQIWSSLIFLEASNPLLDLVDNGLPVYSSRFHGLECKVNQLVADTAARWVPDYHIVWLTNFAE